MIAPPPQPGVNVLNYADPEALTTALLAETGNDPSLLVQHLHKMQLQYSHVPETAVRSLAAGLGLTEAQVRSVIGFYSFLWPRSSAPGCAGAAAPASRRR
jgi:NADH:ubiquinone oxidoreductase subunit E